MSRIGRKPIEIPGTIKVVVEGKKVKIEAKGEKLEHVLPEGFSADIIEKQLIITRPSDSNADRALHGTNRSLINNMIIGIDKGFEKKLEISGVGYKAQMKGKMLVLEIGKSHPVNYSPYEGVTIETISATELVVKGINKQAVGQTAAEIRGLYPPEPYKGKGIKYAGEYVRRKQGKSIA